MLEEEASWLEEDLPGTNDRLLLRLLRSLDEEPGTVKLERPRFSEWPDPWLEPVLSDGLGLMVDGIFE